MRMRELITRCGFCFLPFVAVACFSSKLRRTLKRRPLQASQQLPVNRGKGLLSFFLQLPSLVLECVKRFSGKTTKTPGGGRPRTKAQDCVGATVQQVSTPRITGLCVRGA